MNQNRIKRVARDLQQLTAREMMAVVGHINNNSGTTVTESISRMFIAAIQAPEEAASIAKGKMRLVAKGATPILVIKVLREYFNLPLKTAKDLAESAPVVLEGMFQNCHLDLNDERKKAAATALREAGATVGYF